MHTQHTRTVNPHTLQTAAHQQTEKDSVGQSGPAARSALKALRNALEEPLLKCKSLFVQWYFIVLTQLQLEFIYIYCQRNIIINNLGHVNSLVIVSFQENDPRVLD